MDENIQMRIIGTITDYESHIGSIVMLDDWKFRYWRKWNGEKNRIRGVIISAGWHSELFLLRYDHPIEQWAEISIQLIRDE